MFSPELLLAIYGGEGRIPKGPLRRHCSRPVFRIYASRCNSNGLGNDGLMTKAFLWGLTIVLCALILTPFLALGRKRGLPETDATVKMLREGLSEFNEGVGKWRALSHVRGEFMGLHRFHYRMLRIH